MATLGSPTNPASLQETDPQHKASRISIRPTEALTWQSVGVPTGLITGLAAGAPIFSLRNLSTINNLAVKRVGIGYIASTAFTAAQRLEYNLFVARGFTGSDTGGTVIALTGSNAKLRTSLATVTGVDMRVATTTALLSGVRTLDATPLAIQACYSAAIGVNLQPAANNLLSQDSADYPLILAPNEGIVLTNAVIMGAGGIGIAYINLVFAEVAPAVF